MQKVRCFVVVLLTTEVTSETSLMYAPSRPLQQNVAVEVPADVAADNTVDVASAAAAALRPTSSNTPPIVIFLTTAAEPCNGLHDNHLDAALDALSLCVWYSDCLLAMEREVLKMIIKSKSLSHNV